MTEYTKQGAHGLLTKKNRIIGKFFDEIEDILAQLLDIIDWVFVIFIHIIN